MQKVTIDLSICASEEAQICLNCELPKCSPYECERFKQMKKKLKQEKATPKQKNLKAGGNFKNENIKQVK